MARRTTRRIAIVAAIVAMLALVATAIFVTRRGNEPEQAAPPVEVPGPPHAVIAVKIDNVAAARPQTGIAAASVVYVEPVEGGLTRLLAVYTGKLPDVIGPVRSARLTDIELLGQFGAPTLAYSGASRKVLPQLRAASLISASPAERPAAYFRSSARAAPHNLYVRARELPEPASPPPSPVMKYGSVSGSGVPTPEYRVSFPAARYDFAWSAERRRWSITMDGSPMTSTDAGPLTAETVVEQEVEVTMGGSRDAGGNPSPVAKTVGSGEATVLRDGKRFDAHWSRTAPDQPTRFRTAEGTDLPMATGGVWVLLVPAR